MAWLRAWLEVISFSVAVLMASVSSPSSAVLRSVRAASAASFSEPLTLSPCSRRTFSVWYTRVSAWLRVSASSLRLRSSSAWASASLIIWSMALLSSDD